VVRRHSLIGAQLLAFAFALGAFSVNATACEGGGGGGGELTSLSTTLSGGGKEGAELTVSEGTKVKDKATLTGKNASKATGKVTYKVYSESACKTLVTSAGEVTVSGESVPASSEEELEAGRAYYWQAHYGGESKNAESTSPCTEILEVKAKTSLSTKLSGESKEGEELTIDEGFKGKDTATLSGTNSSSAGGKLVYKVYSDKECKTLVKEAGEVTVSSGSVPASSEEELEGGKTYYWQATYKGDGLHQESTSSCGKEVLDVKAKTTLATTLSGGGEEGEELTVDEGTKIKDKASLSGVNPSTATGSVTYEVYLDSKCEHLVASAGERTVSGGSAGASGEEELEGGAVYYWQATYSGDSLHQKATSACTSEKATIRAATSITTKLTGQPTENAPQQEGSEITVVPGSEAIDTATLHGIGASSAKGHMTFTVYTDGECHEAAGEPEEVELGEAVASSVGHMLSSGSYYWQVEYSGDALHQKSTSPCTSEIAVVKSPISVATSLAGGEQEGAEITVEPGAAVRDAATLSGPEALAATGSVKYAVYSDSECTKLVAEAGESTVMGASVPPSAEETLEPGTYYWQASYGGDATNHDAKSPCGSEILKVSPPITTTLSAEGHSGESLQVLEGGEITDQAVLHGLHVAGATGTVTYRLYKEDKCEELAESAGTVTVSGPTVPASSAVTPALGTYYVQAEYSGDEENPKATSECGGEVVSVESPTTLTSSLSGGEASGTEITVGEQTPVTDEATLGGSNVATAGGLVTYDVYSDPECKELAAVGGVVEVSGASVAKSIAVSLPYGRYYWQATYTGDGVNHEATGECGAEIENSTGPVTIELAGNGETGDELLLPEKDPVTATATLHGPHASSATGSVTYEIFSDDECKTLVETAGEVPVSGASVPVSDEATLESGTYYWVANYSGDELNPPAKSRCTRAKVFSIGSSDMYAALGDSFSVGLGTLNYYSATNNWFINRCRRSRRAWPVRIAETLFGAGVGAEGEVILQQPRNFIFRGCSGAVTENMWHPGGAADGQYNELARTPLGALVEFTKPAQDLWLELPGGTPPGGVVKPNNAIRLVTFTTGGNDTGFATIAKECTHIPWFYSPAQCIAVIEEWQRAVPGAGGTFPSAPAYKQGGLPSIEKKLETVLNDVHVSAPNAIIRVPLYPQLLDTKFRGNISVGIGAVIDNMPPPGGGATIAQRLEGFTNLLNAEIQRTVTAWAAANGVDAETVPDTATAFAGHQLGNAFPWANGLLESWNYEASYHPNCEGNRAMAREVLKALGVPRPGGWVCP
jgi:predicted  nucleic acid-binding Zn ribbon protein